MTTCSFLRDAGKVFWLKVHEIPEAGRAAKGKAMVNLLALSGDEKVTAILPVKEFRDDRYVFMATRQGVIKKTELSAYSNPRQGGIIASRWTKVTSLSVCRSRMGSAKSSRHPAGHRHSF